MPPLIGIARNTGLVLNRVQIDVAYDCEIQTTTGATISKIKDAWPFLAGFIEKIVRRISIDAGIF